MKKKQTLFLSLIGILIIGVVILIIILLNNGKKDPIKGNNNEYKNTAFEYNIIKKANIENNFIISPLSIGYSLNVLKEGADGKTLEELDNLLNNYDIKNINNVDNVISLSNALFINDNSKDNVKDSYVKLVKNKYNADINYDDFTSPYNINNYVKEKTFDMIPKALDNIDPSTLLAIINTIAIDVEWNKPFEKENNFDDTFKTLENDIKVTYMNGHNDVKYIENGYSKGIIKEYKSYNGNELEYIAIMPNGNLKEYINKFDENEFKNLLNSAKEPSRNLSINVSIPKYSFDYGFDNLKSSLIDLGIGSSFDELSANFSKIGNDIYVDDIIHKTHIDFLESGTKAAAATIITMKDNAIIPMDKDEINIVFNKPFMFIIKDKNSENIMFFGTVYNPNEK